MARDFRELDPSRNGYYTSDIIVHLAVVVGMILKQLTKLPHHPPSIHQVTILDNTIIIVTRSENFVFRFNRVSWEAINSDYENELSDESVALLSVLLCLPQGTYSM